MTNIFAFCNNLYINTLTFGVVLHHLLPGGDTHSPHSVFLRLLAPVASELPIDSALKKNKGSYLELFTIMLFYLSDKAGNSGRIV